MSSPDPYRNVRFILEIEGMVVAGFSTCRIPKNTTDVIEYREGHESRGVRKLAGLNRYGRLVLETGVTDSTELFEWYLAVQQGKMDHARRAVAIVLLDLEGNTAARWELKKAWPATYQAPRLDATGEDVAIETLEIVCEGLKRVTDMGETEGDDASDGGYLQDDYTLDDGEGTRGHETDVDDRPA